MSDLSITVSAPAGADCKDLISQMARLANRLRVDVDMKLNDVLVVARPYCDVERLQNDWEQQLASPSRYKMAIGKPCVLGTVSEEARHD